MNKNEQDETSPYLKREIAINRLRDILIFIPFLVAAFFLSPAVDLVSVDNSFLGIPLKYFVFFLFWFFAILAIRRTNKSMRARLAEREQ